MNSASPTWGDVESFLRADGWRQIPTRERGGRRQKHVYFEKVLDDGRVLQTHISHSRSKGPGRDRFHLILREQIEVSKEDFWAAIASGQPVDRPAALDQVEVRAEHPSWVIAVLVGPLHLTPDEIAALSEEAAMELVHKYYSRPREE